MPPPPRLFACRLPAGVGPAAVVVACLALGACSSTVINPAAIADAQTAARVKTVLVNDAELGTRAIEVDVSGGIARLSGRVRSQEEAERAEALARGVMGVLDVLVALQVGADDPEASEAPVGPPVSADDALLDFGDDLLETQPDPGLLSIGVALGWSEPRAGRLGDRVALSPLIRLGSGRGAGIAVGFDWINADLQSTAGGGSLTRVHLRPVMLGLRYTVGSPRISLSPSVVAGYAFNSVTVTDTGLAQDVAIEADNSLAWRPGASVWFHANRRIALNVSAGYLVTGLRLTVIEDGRLTKRRVRGDSALVHAGVAYRLF